ncbi:hypothetical protein ACQP3D_27240, partial [Escherichia coli]
HLFFPVYSVLSSLVFNSGSTTPPPFYPHLRVYEACQVGLFLLQLLSCHGSWLAEGVSLL